MNRELTKTVFGRDDLFYIQTIPFTKGKGFQKGRKFLFSLEKGLIRHDKLLDNIEDKYKDITKEIINEEKYNKEDYEIENMIETFITNLILFFNEQRITIYINEHNNERRIRKNKIPIPSQIITKMSFDLENYIEKIYFNGQSNSHLDYAFWVRGHKRRLISPRYKEQKIIWVSAFLKGEGLQPPQIHKIE
jgi:hypothetical protein